MYNGKHISSPMLFYPLRLLRRRPITLLSGSAVLFCLVSLLTLSLFLSESGYLASLAEGGTGGHYGVVYRLSREQYRTFLNLQDELKGTFFTVPVYARMEDVESEEGILSVAVFTEEAAAWYGMDISLTEDAIALPDILCDTDPYYLPQMERSIFFHGQTADGKQAGHPVTMPLTIRRIGRCNDRSLPYVFVSQTTADEIYSMTGGEITYDLYFTTPRTSDLAAAQIIDQLYDKLHLTSSADGVQPAQSLHEGKTRRLIYRDYINYPLLDLLNREYMDDPSFFFLLLPTILAASFAAAGLLRENLEVHLKEYGILKASGGGMRILYGTLYCSAFLLLLFAVLPALLTTLCISGTYRETVQAMLHDSGLSPSARLSVGLPVGNLLTVCLYVLFFTCVLTYLLTRRLLSAHPSALLHHAAGENLPDVQMSAWQVLNRRDPVGYMVKIQFRRERKRRLYHAFTDTLLMGVCGHMVVTMADTAGVEILYTLYLYGAWLLIMTLNCFGEIRQQKRELAILRQCGTSDRTIRRRFRWMQFYSTLLGMGVTVGLFLALLALPYLLPGWVFNNTPMIAFLLSYKYQFGLLSSLGMALVLETGNLFMGQIITEIPVRRMLKRGILKDLRSTE